MKKIFLSFLLSVLLLPSISLAQATDPVKNGDPSAVLQVCLDLENNIGYRAWDIGPKKRVSTIQNFLNLHGYLNYEPTGYFGLATFGAVKKLQLANGIEPTGYVGPLTRSMIKILTCPEFSVIPMPAIRELAVASTTNIGRPVNLEIPQIKIDASIEYLDLTALGAVATPKGPTNVGWFELGPRPGEVGSAVLVGHYGWKDKIQTVFDNLNKLEIDDKFFVRDENNKTLTFVVREIKKYNPQADATEIFSSSDGKAHLNLITCGGIWNKSAQSYSERLVVFTDLE